ETTVPIVIDSTPPQVSLAGSTPTVVNANSKGMTFKVRASENFNGFALVKNAQTGQMQSYPLTVTRNEGSTEGKHLYLKAPQMPLPVDGLYQVSYILTDEAGNQSNADGGYFIVDTKGPVIKDVFADPMLLSKHDGYDARIRFTVDDDGIYRKLDDAQRKTYRNTASNPTVFAVGSSTSSTVHPDWLQDDKTKLAYSVTVIRRSSEGATPIAVLASDREQDSPTVYAVGSLPVFTEHWDAKSSSIPAGSYQFKITVRDWAGNEFTAYPDFIKDGVQPVINTPRAGQTISGVIGIRGAAQDPDLGNGDPFARYALYYKAGDQSALLKDKTLAQINLADWKGAASKRGELGAIYVPVDHHQGADLFNVSRRPISSLDAMLGYWSTIGLENGPYTLLLTTEEQNGGGAFSYQVLTVVNDEESVKANQGRARLRSGIRDPDTGKDTKGVHVDYSKKTKKE
ncbi:MAG: Ig-like domain repeat protein, partial [Candidatus Margulisiibacteriota bacterium]